MSSGTLLNESLFSDSPEVLDNQILTWSSQEACARREMERRKDVGKVWGIRPRAIKELVAIVAEKRSQR
jgi:hypothetical protein